MSHTSVDKGQREVDVLVQSNKHPNVVDILDKENGPLHLYVVLELCDGTISDFVHLIRPVLTIWCSTPAPPSQACVRDKPDIVAPSL